MEKSLSGTWSSRLPWYIFFSHLVADNVNYSVYDGSYHKNRAHRYRLSKMSHKPCGIKEPEEKPGNQDEG